MVWVEGEEVIENGGYSSEWGVKLHSSYHEGFARILRGAGVKGPRAVEGEPPGFGWEV